MSVSISSDGSARGRPEILQSKSFTRFEPPYLDSQARIRSHTLQTSKLIAPTSPTADRSESDDQGRSNSHGDVFDKTSPVDDPVGQDENDPVIASSPRTIPEGFDELPIELISLTDRFITSLTSAKVYSTPPSIEKLSTLFQDFYIQAENSISLHIQTLSTRQIREASPAAPMGSKPSNTPKVPSRLGSKSSKDTLSSSEQQMLTPQEVANRRRARKLLELRRFALEEAVERRACERIYDKIWRHRGTLDEMKDDKLRSKTAALALVGINLKDLGIDFDGSKDVDVLNADVVTIIEDGIAQARDELLRMNESRNPFGKLQRLGAAHQYIVALLTQLHQSSSSADEILPTLIYTLITSPPEGISVVSNLNFIQRFRNSSKINGEAAYCLTNLEAAITFLETVDLASLRSDEVLEGPPKSTEATKAALESQSSKDLKLPSTARFSSPAVNTSIAAVSQTTPIQSSEQEVSSAPKAAPTGSPSHHRRVSSLFQGPTSAFGAASDAVRTTADEGFKNIGNTLDSSFKLLFGRLKEQNIQGAGSDVDGTVIVPKTLDDARKLVSPKPLIDDDGNISGASSFIDQANTSPGAVMPTMPRSDDRLLDLIVGTKHIRDRSVDSVGSTSSGKRIPLAIEANHVREKAGSPSRQFLTPSPPQNIPTSAPNAAVESMRNLGNTLNPLNRLAGMTVMRGFGRSPPSTSPVPAEMTKEFTSTGSFDIQESTLKTRMQPALQKFLELPDAQDLKIGEITELLEDYKRLAKVIKDMQLV